MPWSSPRRRWPAGASSSPAGEQLEQEQEHEQEQEQEREQEQEYEQEQEQEQKQEHNRIIGEGAGEE